MPRLSSRGGELWIENMILREVLRVSLHRESHSGERLTLTGFSEAGVPVGFGFLPDGFRLFVSMDGSRGFRPGAFRAGMSVS